MHALFDTLRDRGWTVQLSAAPRRLLPPSLAERYPELPIDLVTVLSHVELCSSPDETAWMLTADDYHRVEADGFRWNEYELMALEATDGDLALQRRIVELWDRQFPFMMSVRSDYDYLALSLETGAIVHGCAPEWEETSIVASDFTAFARDLDAQIRSGQWPLEIFFGGPPHR